MYVCMYVYLFLRGTASGGGAEREGDTGSEAGSRLRAVSTEPDAGLEPTNREIRPELKSVTGPTEPPGCPPDTRLVWRAFRNVHFQVAVSVGP